MVVVVAAEVATSSRRADFFQGHCNIASDYVCVMTGCARRTEKSTHLLHLEKEVEGEG